MAEPNATLHVRDYGYLSGTDPDVFDNPAFIIEDEDMMIGGLLNIGNSDDETHGGLFVIRGIPSSVNNGIETPAFGVFDVVNELLPFAVTGDGTVAIGVPMEGWEPDAQLTVEKRNAYDYMVKIADKTDPDPENHRTLFSVSNLGYTTVGELSYPSGNAGRGLFEINSIKDDLGSPQFYVGSGDATNSNLYFMVSGKRAGIGINPNTMPSTLAMKGASGTSLDIYETTANAWDAQIRFVNSTGTAIRHVITDDLTSNNLIIHPGNAGGANSMVKVEGDEFVTKTLGVGIDVQNTLGGASTVAIKSPNTTILSLHDPGLSGSDRNTQIQFCNTAGYARHIITDGNGNLLLMPGADFVANKKVEVDGDLLVNGMVQIGDVTVPNSNYMLFVEKGILSERFKCALKTDNVNWSDYVFKKDYKLMSIEELEKFVKKNHHLPNIPSAEEVYRDGIDLAIMDAKLLEKIEELALYVIELKKEMELLKKKK